MFYTGTYIGGAEVAARFPYQVGIVTFMAYPSLLKSDEGASRLIRGLIEDPFFDLLELPPIGISEWQGISEASSKSGRRVSFALGLQPEILVRGLNPSSTSEEERRRAEERFTELAGEACSRGYVAVALCSGPNVPEAERGRALEAFKKTVSAVAEKAGECGIPVYIETFDTDVDKKRLIGRLDVAARLVDDLRGSHGNVYILWDLSHGPLLGEKPEDLKSYADIVGHIHIGAAKVVEGRMYDYHPGFHRPGAINDERDVAALLSVLDDVSYRGAISFEVKPEEGQLSEEVIASSKSVLIRAFQLFIEGRV